MIRPALVYWAVIFALGFALGTARVLWGNEALGEATFLLIEIPVIMLASWFAARWLVLRYSVCTDGEALAMGGLAFALLMAAELILSSMLEGGGASAWLGSLMHPPGLYGLLGQIAFALLPWIAARAHSSGG